MSVESALLMAARNGITEMVEKIIGKYPIAIYDKNCEKKNIALLAAEHRQPRVYQLLLEKQVTREIFREVDDKGNSALHLAAKLNGEPLPWTVSGAAVQLQWEIKWVEYIRSSMPPNFFPKRNKENKTSEAIFTETHAELLHSSRRWLGITAQASSVVAGLFVTIIFSTSVQAPGGLKEGSGSPTFGHSSGFEVYAVSSLLGFYLSVAAVIMFLAILTSGFEEGDFAKALLRKLLLGLIMLYGSISCTLVSFSAAHFFILKDELHNAAFPLYTAACLVVLIFSIAQFPLIFQLVWATFKTVPQRDSS